MLLRFPEVSSREGAAVITEWYTALETKVEKGQDIVEVSSDKATFDISSPCDGVLVKIFKAKGETVLAGEVMAEIQE